MAIIRIKRTTGNSLPTGLTFGELAFVQGSGGFTANRLYIANNAGVCVWVGAEILNTPTYWSGATAQTTIPTVSAVRDALIAGVGSNGVLTFSSDLSVNISAGKYFGKYTRGDTIPAQGQTVKWVIENALSETIAPTINALTFNSPNNSVAFGQTAGSISVNVNYTIKTAGACAAGSTLEFRYGNGTWTTLSPSLKSDSNGTDQPYSATYLHSFNRLTDTGADGRWGTARFNYRYTVHDTAGSSASNTGFIDPATSANPSTTWSTLSAASLRTGIFGATNGTETNYYREKGNTFTTVNFTVNRGNSYIPLTGYQLQVREFVNGAYGSWTGVTSASVSNNPPTVTRAVSFTPSASGASLDQMQFRVRINDEYYDGSGSNPGTTYDQVFGESPEVYFNYMIFYGATLAMPTTGSDFRGLCSGLIAGNPTVNFGSGAAIGANGMSNPFAGLPGAGTNVVFIVAFPDGVTLTSVIDSNINQAVNFAEGGSPNTTFTTIPDRSGVNKNYNVYIMKNTQAYGDSRYHTVTRSSDPVTQP